MADDSIKSSKCVCCNEDNAEFFCYTCDPSANEPVEMCLKCSTSVHIGPMKLSHKVKALINEEKKKKLKQLYVEVVGKNQNRYEVVSTQLTDAAYDLADVQGHVQRMVLDLFETPLKSAVIAKKRELNTLVEEYYRNKKALVQSGLNKCRELQLRDVSLQTLPWNGTAFEEFLPNFQTFSFNCDIEERINEIVKMIENIKLETKITHVCPKNTLEEATVETDKEMFVYLSGCATPDGLFWLKIARREDEIVYRILSYDCRKRLIVDGGAESPFLTDYQSLSTGLLVMVFHPNEKSWRRAVIENPQMTPDLKVSVIFVDFGNKMLVSIKDMIKCSDEDFQIPYMAYPCSLTATKESFSSRDQMWKLQDFGRSSNHRGPALLKAVFRHTLGSDEIQATCIPVWYVDLYTTDDEPVHVNQVIHNMKLAGEKSLTMSKDMRVSNGEAVPVVRTIVDMTNAANDAEFAIKTTRSDASSNKTKKVAATSSAANQSASSPNKTGQSSASLSKTVQLPASLNKTDQSDAALNEGDRPNASLKTDQSHATLNEADRSDAALNQADRLDAALNENGQSNASLNEHSQSNASLSETNQTAASLSETNQTAASLNKTNQSTPLRIKTAQSAVFRHKTAQPAFTNNKTAQSAVSAKKTDKTAVLHNKTNPSTVPHAQIGQLTATVFKSDQTFASSESTNQVGDTSQKRESQQFTNQDREHMCAASSASTTLQPIYEPANTSEDSSPAKVIEKALKNILLNIPGHPEAPISSERLVFPPGGSVTSPENLVTFPKTQVCTPNPSVSSRLQIKRPSLATSRQRTSSLPTHLEMRVNGKTCDFQLESKPTNSSIVSAARGAEVIDLCGLAEEELVNPGIDAENSTAHKASSDEASDVTERGQPPTDRNSSTHVWKVSLASGEQTCVTNSNGGMDNESRLFKLSNNETSHHQPTGGDDSQVYGKPKRKKKENTKTVCKKFSIKNETVTGIDPKRSYLTTTTTPSNRQSTLANLTDSNIETLEECEVKAHEDKSEPQIEPTVEEKQTKGAALSEGDGPVSVAGCPGSGSSVNGSSPIQEAGDDWNSDGELPVTLPREDTQTDQEQARLPYNKQRKSNPKPRHPSNGGKRGRASNYQRGGRSDRRHHNYSPSNCSNSSNQPTNPNSYHNNNSNNGNQPRNVNSKYSSGSGRISNQRSISNSPISQSKPAGPDESQPVAQK